MAKKISQLTQATEVKSDDVTVIVQDGETKKLPLNMMVTKQDIENKKIAGLAKLDEIEATYENDTYTPTITVKNKSSVKVGEGDGVDYSANVMDGHVKSAILKGQTKVIDELGNECESPNIPRITIGAWIDTTNGIETASERSFNTTFLKCPTVGFVVKGNNKYKRIIFYDRNKRFIGGINRNTIDNSSVTINSSEIPTNGIYIRISASIGDPPSGVSYTPDTKLLIEDENGNNIYITHLESVKMPVLKTTGKNLCNTSKYIHGGVSDNRMIFSKNQYRSYYMKCKPSTVYTVKVENSNNRFGVASSHLFSEDTAFKLNKYLSTPSSDVTGQTLQYMITTTEKDEYLYVYVANNGVFNPNIRVQVEEGSVATPYEPYKSNILTVNEPVELRGIGDVKDTLDCLTGELTQRIGEVVLDGSDIAYTNNNSYMTEVSTAILTSTFSNYIINKPIMCDDFPVYTHNDGIWEKEKNIVSGVSLVSSLWGFCVRLPHTLTGVSTVDSEDTVKQKFKAYLQSNPITIQYQFETPTIKTVDLMPSGTHPSTTPYCWKNGLIQLSSSGLLPNLEYSVVTSRAGQINQNATMIVKNDKRIFDLEILLAGGLVNTTYQALTLQNQVETGLSKVSLNSETEPDYLLYHMIMKLIEEKAYKLDDLTEKVSVFYLYEKLSDEQFETIYSALYPFVEDEIVEEPVVEELPEVVEDEVIM